MSMDLFDLGSLNSKNRSIFGIVARKYQGRKRKDNPAGRKVISPQQSPFPKAPAGRHVNNKKSTNTKSSIGAKPKD